MPSEFQTRFKTYDPDLCWQCAVLTNRLGLDCASTSNIISWLMRLHEEGIIGAADTDGIPMDWGSREAVLAMIEKIARKEGFGKVLADGVLPASRRIGKSSHQFAQHIKGVEYLNYWSWPGLVLGQTVRTGAGNPHADASSVENAGNIIQCLLEDQPPIPGMTKAQVEEMVTQLRSAKTSVMCGDPDAWKLFDDDGTTIRTKNKAAWVLGFENQTRLADLVGICDQSTGAGPRSIFALRNLWEEMAAFLAADLGEDHTPDMLKEVVNRVRLQERGYDYLCGLRREDETLPDDFFEPKKTRKWGTRKFMQREHLEKMKTEYYTLRGCDPATGAPRREELEKLGLKDLADRLGKLDLKPETTSENDTDEQETK